jgi:hypothetical protein
MKALVCPYLPLLCALVAAATTTGCATAVGYFVGASWDSPSSPGIAPSDWQRLSEGDEIEVCKSDGTVIAGRYVGTACASPEVYPSFYELHRAQCPAEARPPAVGDTIRIDIVARPERVALFLGVETTDSRSGPVPAIRFRPVGWQMDQVQPISTVKSIEDASGHVFGPTSLKEWVPTPRVLILQCEAVGTHIPIHEIASIRGGSLSDKRWLGAAVGLLVDAAFVAAALTSDWLTGLEHIGF